MATATQISLRASFSLSTILGNSSQQLNSPRACFYSRNSHHHQRRPPTTSTKQSSRSRSKILATAPDLLGDFGARDPFPAEIASNFGEKVIGNASTEHKILIPNASVLSLAQLACSPISPQQPPLSPDETRQLMFKVVGWRLVDEGGSKLQCLWKLRDSSCASELIKRIQIVVESTGHPQHLHIEQLEPNQVRAELWTASIGGLSMNDFIIAAKIDAIKVNDLLPRKRAWA